ncbi:MAG: PQQ-dependent sugar dehydrogenase [Desertimonas sp.]
MTGARLARVALVAGLVMVACGGDAAAGAADPSAELVEIAVVNQPVDLAWRIDDEHLYIVQQEGRVQRIDPTGQAEAVVALDVVDLISSGGEQGLLGLAFSPDGTLAYVNYTDLDGATVISEHPVDDEGIFGDGDLARTVLRIDQPYANHNGGDLAFGPDGYLYIGTGDGGSGGDPERHASDPTSLLGKMLRIDPAISDGEPYTVPGDNPFVGDEGTAPEIWSSGLRSPWRFSFDPVTGDLWIADVGQNTVEEVDAVLATDGVDAGRGADFGWSAYEGDQPFNDDVSTSDPVEPVYTYGRDDGCSVSGGVRARGEAAGSLDGWYVFGDFCANQVWALEVTDGEGTISVERRVVVADGVPAPSAITEGPNGEIYALSHHGGIYRLDA